MYVFLPKGSSGDCNVLDYEYGTKEWQECVLASSEHAAEKYSNPDSCKDVDPGAKGGCYIQVARKTNNYAICEQYKDEIEQTIGGLGLCFQMVAVENSNIAACDRATQVELDPNKKSADDCYAELAFTSKNIEVCNKISEEERKQFCLENAGG